MLWDGPDEFAQPTAVVHDRCGACRDLGAPALGEQRLRQATPVGVDTQQKAVSGGSRLLTSQKACVLGVSGIARIF